MAWETDKENWWLYVTKRPQQYWKHYYRFFVWSFFAQYWLYVQCCCRQGHITLFFIFGFRFIRMTKESKISTFADIILILMFSGFICLIPGGSIWQSSNPSALGENRKLATCPSFKTDSIETIPAKFETFYNDPFGFRKELIKSHNWIRYKLLKGSSTGNVLTGKDNWLFLTT